MLEGWSLKRRLRDVMTRLELRSTLKCPMVLFFVNGIPNYTNTRGELAPEPQPVFCHRWGETGRRCLVLREVKLPILDGLVSRSGKFDDLFGSIRDNSGRGKYIFRIY